jgi:hypothetical protein
MQSGIFERLPEVWLVQTAGRVIGVYDAREDAEADALAFGLSASVTQRPRMPRRSRYRYTCDACGDEFRTAERLAPGSVALCPGHRHERIAQ